MIGLGSNRLSVCRRGGMSVTQAGRGGMEWLAGGRVPSWVSPYSAQATAALKAQFPTQWPTIRDYGFAHPALVPFINEDPMVICSVGIQGLPIRGLYQSTTGYFETSYYPNGSDKFEVMFKYKQFIANYYGGIYGAYDLNAGDNNCRYYTFNSGNSTTSRFSYKSGYDDSVVAPSYNVRHIAVDNAGTLYIDGTKKKENTQQTFTCAGPFRMFTTGWTHRPERSEGVSIYHGKINDGATLWMVPIKRNGNFEMIDLVSGNLATRVGTFTEFYEMEDGTPWTPAS